MNTLSFLALAIALSTPVSPQQSATVAAPAPFTLDAATKSATLDSLISNLKERYIYPEVADKIAVAVKAWMSSSEYSTLSDPVVFATKVNDLLKKEVTDAHLRFRFSKDVLPVRKEASEPSPEEVKRYREEVKFANAGFDKVERLRGNIGYIAFRGFWEPSDMKRPVAAAMQFLANCDAFIVDLRQNGGGDPAGVQLFCSYFFSEKPVHLNNIYFREGGKVTKTEFWTHKKVDGPRFPNAPLYVLTSKRTGSGAEECAYNFQQLHRGVIIGESTWGGANPGGNVRLTDHFTCFIPVGRAENPHSGKNWEGTGVAPDIKADAPTALKEAHTMALKKLIAEAADEERKADLQQILEEVVKGP